MYQKMSRLIHAPRSGLLNLRYELRHSFAPQAIYLVTFGLWVRGFTLFQKRRIIPICVYLSFNWIYTKKAHGAKHLLFTLRLAAKISFFLHFCLFFILSTVYVLTY